MAAPNIGLPTTITGKTVPLTPAVTTATVLLANAAASGKVLKIENIIAANIDASATIAASVGTNTAADGSGTSTSLILAVPIPAGASLIVSDKSTSFYLEEGKSIVVTSGTASKISYTVSYEEIS